MYASDFRRSILKSKTGAQKFTKCEAFPHSQDRRGSPRITLGEQTKSGANTEKCASCGASDRDLCPPDASKLRKLQISEANRNLRRRTERKADVKDANLFSFQNTLN